MISFYKESKSRKENPQKPKSKKIIFFFLFFWGGEVGRAGERDWSK